MDKPRKHARTEPDLRMAAACPSQQEHCSRRREGAQNCSQHRTLGMNTDTVRLTCVHAGCQQLFAAGYRSCLSVSLSVCVPSLCPCLCLCRHIPLHHRTMLQKVPVGRACVRYPTRAPPPRMPAYRRATGKNIS